MKTKSFILLLFSILTITSFAQFDTRKEKEYKWQIGVNINTVEPITEAGFDYIAGRQTRLFNPTDLSHQKDKSSSFGINISYDIKENCAIRLSAKLINHKIDETYNFKEMVPYSSADYLLDDAHFRQFVINIMPGILLGGRYKKLNFYCGFQLEYKQYSSISFQIRYTSYLTSNNTIQSVKTLDFKQPGGFSIGVGPFVGFSINIFKSIFIGAEFSSAYSYYKTGGERTLVTTFSSGATDNLSVQNSYEASKFSNIITSMNLSINF